MAHTSTKKKKEEITGYKTKSNGIHDEKVRATPIPEITSIKWTNKDDKNKELESGKIFFGDTVGILVEGTNLIKGKLELKILDYDNEPTDDEFAKIVIDASTKGAIFKQEKDGGKNKDTVFKQVKLEKKWYDKESESDDELEVYIFATAIMGKEKDEFEQENYIVIKRGPASLKNIRNTLHSENADDKYLRIVFDFDSSVKKIDEQEKPKSRNSFHKFIFTINNSNIDLPKNFESPLTIAKFGVSKVYFSRKGNDATELVIESVSKASYKMEKKDDNDFYKIIIDIRVDVSNEPVRPVRSGSISSPYGPRSDGFHPGIDIVGPGTEHDVDVYAAYSGIVDFVGWQDSANSKVGFGYYVRIKNIDDNICYYGHLRANTSTLSIGDPIDANDGIGIMGNTGRMSGSLPSFEPARHLHFELRGHNPIDVSDFY